MTEEIKIIEKPDLVREKASTAIINSNVNAFKQAKNLRAKRLSEAQRLDVLEQKMNRILELLENRD